MNIENAVVIPAWILKMYYMSMDREGSTLRAHVFGFFRQNKSLLYVAEDATNTDEAICKGHLSDLAEEIQVILPGSQVIDLSTHEKMVVHSSPKIIDLKAHRPPLQLAA